MLLLGVLVLNPIQMATAQAWAQAWAWAWARAQGSPQALLPPPAHGRLPPGPVLGLVLAVGLTEAGGIAAWLPIPPSTASNSSRVQEGQRRHSPPAQPPLHSLPQQQLTHFTRAPGLPPSTLAHTRTHTRPAMGMGVGRGRDTLVL